MGPMRNPETSVLKALTRRNNPEDGRIQSNRGGSPRSCFEKVNSYFTEDIRRCYKENPVRVLTEEIAVHSQSESERTQDRVDKWSFFKTLKHVVRLVTLKFTELRSNAEPIPVADRSKAKVCGRSLVGVVGSNPAGGTDV